MDVMTEKKLVPKLRFREFQDDWEKNKLADVATFYNSKRVALTASDREKGEYPYYGASGIIDYVKDFIFEGEYILLGEDGANIVMRNSRLVFLAKGKFWLNNHAHIFQSKDSNTFLCEALERINYTKYNSGTAQPKLNSDVVKKIQLHLPSFPEQQKIASFLSAVDKKLQKLSKKKELLEEYKKGVMQKIFSQELRFKDDNENNYPDWEEKKLGEVCEVTVGGTPSTTKKEYWNGDIGWISSGGLNNGNVTHPSKLITKLGLDNSSAKMMPENTVMLAMTGATLGKIGYLKFNSSANQSVAGFLPDETYNSKYLFYTLQQGINQVFKYSGGAAQQGINKQSILNLKYGFPCIDEQYKIANFLSSLDSKIDLVSRKTENTKAFKKGLLQQMFV